MSTEHQLYDEDSREMDKFVVRLPAGMRDQIKSSARANFQSMNAFVVDTMERKLVMEQQLPTLRFSIGDLCKMGQHYFVVDRIYINEGGLPCATVSHHGGTLQVLYIALELP